MLPGYRGGDGERAGNLIMKQEGLALGNDEAGKVLAVAYARSALTAK